MLFKECTLVLKLIFLCKQFKKMIVSITVLIYLKITKSKFKFMKIKGKHEGGKCLVHHPV